MQTVALHLDYSQYVCNALLFYETDQKNQSNNSIVSKLLVILLSLNNTRNFRCFCSNKFPAFHITTKNSIPLQCRIINCTLCLHCIDYCRMVIKLADMKLLQFVNMYMCDKMVVGLCIS